jgi:hypothetical protein
MKLIDDPTLEAESSAPLTNGSSTKRGLDRDASSDGRATRHRNVDVVFRFAHDSPLEEGGFEPSVPLWGMAPGPASAELRKVPAGQLRFAPDSPLEREGFEPSVPREEEPARRDGFCSTLPALPFRERPRRSRPALHGIATPKYKHPAPWQLAGCEARRLWVFTVWIRSTRMIPHGAGHRKRAPCGYVLDPREGPDISRQQDTGIPRAQPSGHLRNFLAVATRTSRDVRARHIQGANPGQHREKG